MVVGWKKGIKFWFGWFVGKRDFNWVVMMFLIWGVVYGKNGRIFGLRFWDLRWGRK